MAAVSSEVSDPRSAAAEHPDVPEAGQLVEVRGQQWVVSHVSSSRQPQDELAATRIPGRVDELTGRMPSSRIAESLAELEHPFDPSLDSTAALDELRRDPEAYRARAAGRSYPIDVLLATSMLQVGVDVQRLGLMVVTGSRRTPPSTSRPRPGSAARGNGRVL
jgi:hypothetical protein